MQQYQRRAIANRRKICPQTYEFGNFGCTRVVAIVASPLEQLTAKQFFSVRILPTAPVTSLFGAATRHDLGAFEFDLTAFVPLPARNADTVSVLIEGSLVDDALPHRANGQVGVAAIDTVLHLLHIAGVGSPRTIDTVHITLRKLQAP